MINVAFLLVITFEIWFLFRLIIYTEVKTFKLILLQETPHLPVQHYVFIMLKLISNVANLLK